jgi:hypothetical protein
LLFFPLCIPLFLILIFLSAPRTVINDCILCIHNKLKYFIDEKAWTDQIKKIPALDFEINMNHILIQHSRKFYIACICTIIISILGMFFSVYYNSNLFGGITIVLTVLLLLYLYYLNKKGDNLIAIRRSALSTKRSIDFAQETEDEIEVIDQIWLVPFMTLKEMNAFYDSIHKKKKANL